MPEYIQPINACLNEVADKMVKKTKEKPVAEKPLGLIAQRYAKIYELFIQDPLATIDDVAVVLQVTDSTVRNSISAQGDNLTSMKRRALREHWQRKDSVIDAHSLLTIADDDEADMLRELIEKYKE